MKATWINGTVGEIEIAEGEAVGKYPFTAYTTVEDGVINLGRQFVGEGAKARWVMLRLRMSNFPGLETEMAERRAAASVTHQAEYDARSGDRRVDDQMRQAGFEAAGNAGDLMNRLNPVKGGF